MRPAFDPRIWLPVAVAAAWFAQRPAPLPPLPAPSRVASIALPALQGLPLAADTRRYELDAASTTVRFLARGPRGELLVGCDRVRGELTLADAGRSGELELHFDLGSLRPVGAAAGSVDVHHVLGVHRGSAISWRGRLVASTTTDLPGVSRCTWLGTLRFGSLVQRQPMQLWSCHLPGQPLRLQGHGSVAGADYGLPRRTWLGLIVERHEVTLGLDLGWRRRREG